jgi:hypothetical protein
MDGQFEETSSSGIGLARIQRMQFWMPLISILTVVIYRIGSLDVLAMDGLGTIVSQPQFLGLLFMGVCDRKCIQKQPPHTADDLKEDISSVVSDSRQAF